MVIIICVGAYNYLSFDFCEAADADTGDRDPVENLGQVREPRWVGRSLLEVVMLFVCFLQVVFGERLRASPYDVSPALLTALISFAWLMSPSLPPSLPPSLDKLQCEHNC